jgi:hypothetical protein
MRSGSTVQESSDSVSKEIDSSTKPEQSSLGWIAFAQAALPQCRPMEDWEREAADEFLWSEFQSIE